MKTLRIVIGIICCVLSIVILFQSCVVGIGNTLTDDNGETSGISGFIVAIFMLIAGIVGIAGRNSNGAILTSGIFFLVAGEIGTTGDCSSFGDLIYWGNLCYIFCVLYILSIIVTIIMHKKNRLN